MYEHVCVAASFGDILWLLQAHPNLLFGLYEMTRQATRVRQRQTVDQPKTE